MTRKYSRLEDFFQLDAYQLLLQAFYEFTIFTMLSNVVFNVFAAAPPLVTGCEDLGVSFNGTREERCSAWMELGEPLCQDPTLKYDFFSVNVEFTSFCGYQPSETWLDLIIRPLGFVDKARFSTTLQMVGLVISCLFAGQLSDTYGRKKTLLVSLSIVCILQVLSSFTPTMDTFIVSRFLLGLLIGACLTVTPIFVIECLPPAHRFWISTIVTWAPNYMLFAFAAYLAHDWRTLARVSAAANLVAVIILFFLEESPKFLIQKKRREDAIAALVKINRFNSFKATLSEVRSIVEAECGGPEVALLEKGDQAVTVKFAMKSELGCPIYAMKPQKAKKKTYTFLHLYATKTLAVRTIVGSIGQFVLSVATYALMFNMHGIGGSIYVNLLLSGVLRWVVGASVACLDHFGKSHVGRRRMHAITFGLVAACLFVNFVITLFGLQSEWTLVVRSLALLAFASTGCIYLQMALSCSELFPTGIRTLAAAHFNVAGRLGNVVGPNIFPLAAVTPSLPYGLLSALCVTEIVLWMLTIPETKNQPLPNEMPPKKKLRHSKSCPANV